MQFLLERLATPISPSTGQPEPFDLQAAVAAQVQRIVSARARAQDEELNLLGFGMPNVVDLASHSRTQLERYGRQLVRLIEHYEPRLSAPSVKLEPGPGALQPWRLVVSGSLAGDSETRSFRFELPAH